MKSFIKFIGYASLSYTVIKYWFPFLRGIMNKRWLRSFLIAFLAASPMFRNRIASFYSIYMKQADQNGQ